MILKCGVCDSKLSVASDHGRLVHQRDGSHVFEPWSDQIERAYGRRVHYEPRHAPRAGKHRLTCRRDWMPVWVIACPILGFLAVSVAVVVAMRLA